MPRVIGIDPGTLSIDLCGLDEGHLFLDRSIPTADALVSPSLLVDLLMQSGPLHLVAGPSGYGLPLRAAQGLTDTDFRLAYLAAEGEPGGIRGLRALLRALAASPLPVVLTPGVIHLTSVPAHRKVNRVDMGTADKLCTAVLALSEEIARLGARPADVSFILLELGGAFSAALAIDHGRIVDGLGGSSGPMGARAAGALDGEVAFLAGSVSKDLLFGGGAATIADMPGASFDEVVASTTDRARLAYEAFIESAVKAIVSLGTSAPDANALVLSGRVSGNPRVRQDLAHRLSVAGRPMSIAHLAGFASSASHAAQGAALVADGLAGGRSAPLVDTLGVRNAHGTVLDHLHVISQAAARARIGLSE